MATINWDKATRLPSRSYICGYCDNQLASDVGWAGTRTGSTLIWYTYICHHCGGPTFFDSDRSQTPAPKLGDVVSDVSDQSVSNLYEEARGSTTAAAYTAAVLSCRKLLMHIAVSKGAKPGAKFIEYVEYLAANNYVPPDAKPWVDHIREKGNEANHEITIMTLEDAAELLAFSGMLLKLVFEFPAIMRRKYLPKGKP